MLMEYIHIILKQSHKPAYTRIIMLILSLTLTSQGGWGGGGSGLKQHAICPNSSNFIKTRDGRVHERTVITADLHFLA